MGRSYAGRSWVDDLVGGIETGAAMDAMIDAKAERRKQAKQAGAIAGDMDNKLFNVEDKGAIGNFMYNKFGLGDAPQMTPKEGAAVPPPPPTAGTPGAAAPQANGAASAPPSTAREMVASGIRGAAAMSGDGGEAPAPVQAGEFTYNPGPAVTFAPPTPTPEGPAPLMPAMENARPSEVQKMLLKMGIKV